MAAVVQAAGVLLALAVAVLAFGTLGGLGWLATVLYLTGEMMREQVPEPTPGEV